ncbi:hydrogenase expression/formation protein [Jiella marina]|uniref:hydrogenase expression/formation protein n=1 Tax=Jiella sp. LLJ827 TaxID=2917712 RepID=UPI0021019618|nr:hydrogenase expression/formation protein [Jiella sp. LLJ827]MCQ0988215.1 hydrogenase expression/formation protein [Jiella sp. LLJ827]
MTFGFMNAPTGFGPGSQPSEGDGADLDYMPMPSGMRTFHSPIPYLESAEGLEPAIACLRELAETAKEWSPDDGAIVVEAARLAKMDPRNRALIAETLGEGEVSAVVAGDRRFEVQESVFAGVWRVASGGTEHIEIGPLPRAIGQAPAIALAAPPMPGHGVVNAPAILTEIFDHAGQGGSHIVNLTLLPHTPEDLAYLDAVLGDGGVTILSRGYGNCRIERAAAPDIWRVRYFNSQDALILDTIEVGGIPEVALAAPEDIADSAARLAEVAEAIR